MKELPENIKEILIKQLREETGSGYRQLLEEWHRLYPEYAHEFGDIIKIWKESGHILKEPDFDTSNAWVALNNRLANKSIHTDTTIVKSPPTSLSRFMKIMVAAAILAGFLLAGWWMQAQKEPSLQLTTATAANRYLTLPDGTTVWLRKGATIQYPATFSQKERKVLVTGEAFFDVKPAVNRPFRVQTGRSVVEVLGTSFLVHAADRSDRVVVLTGKVLFAGKQNPKQQRILTARQEAVFNGKTFKEKIVADTSCQFWQKDTLNFSKAPLKQVVSDLTAYYRTPVTIADSLAGRSDAITVTASFREQSLEQVLHEITIITGLQYRWQQDSIILY